MQESRRDEISSSRRLFRFVITGWLIGGIGYQIGKIYRKYCWDIISIVEDIT